MATEPRKGLLAFMYCLYTDPDGTLTERFKSDAAGASACMDEFGLTPEQRTAIWAAGLIDPGQKLRENMRISPDLPSMRALTDLIAAELADEGQFKNHW
jgi:hypothetical protein